MPDLHTFQQRLLGRVFGCAIIDHGRVWRGSVECALQNAGCGNAFIGDQQRPFQAKSRDFIAEAGKRAKIEFDARQIVDLRHQPSASM